MTDPLGDLTEKYLAGDLGSDKVRELNQTLTDDPLAADALLSDAYMDVHLRELLNGSALGEAVSGGKMAEVGTSADKQTSGTVFRRLRPRHWATVGAAIAALSGWGVAAYIGGELGEARTHVRTLEKRVAELETASDSLPAAGADVPEIHSLRGWLMALPQNGDANIEGRTLLVGTTAPLDQRIWTCPWGAAEFRYDSGVSISVERNTIVRLHETDNLRRLTLERGIVHVTNLSETDSRPVQIESALATIRLIHGQVAVQVDEHRTAVEVAVNQVEVTTEERGDIRTFTVRRGEYLIIKPGEKAKVIQGMFKLGLEPSDT